MSKIKDKLPDYVRRAANIRQQHSHPRMSYSVKEFAATIGVSRSSVYQALRDGSLTARKAGKRTIIGVEDAKKYLNRLPFWAPARDHLKDLG